MNLQRKGQYSVQCKFFYRKSIFWPPGVLRPDFLCDCKLEKAPAVSLSGHTSLMGPLVSYSPVLINKEMKTQTAMHADTGL